MKRILPEDTSAIADPRLVDLLANPLDKRCVARGRCRLLSDLTLLTAYQAWQLFGGRRASTGTLDPSQMFPIFCNALAQRRLSFSDISPEQLTPYTKETAREAMGRNEAAALNAADKLAAFHLCPYLIKSLVAEDFQGWCGKRAGEFILQLKMELLKTG